MGRYGLELMVWQQREIVPRSPQGVAERVVGIIHAVGSEGRLQTTLIEAGVVSHQRQTLDERFHLSPDIGEDGRVLSVSHRQAMDPRAPVSIVFGFGLDERIERVAELTIANDDDAHRANRTGIVVGGLEVYGGEVVHSDCKLTKSSPILQFLNALFVILINTAQAWNILQSFYFSTFSSW